jgi:hypothetical protein
MTLSPFSVNPLTWKAFDLSSKNKNLDSTLKVLQGQMADFCNQVQSILSNPKLLVSVLNSNGLLQGNSLSTVAVSATITTNQTVNANNAAIVFLDYVWTAAANPTITINNLGNATVFVVLTNSSGAARTYTLAANTPTPTAYTVVQLSVAVANTFSAGVSVNNAARAVIMGISSVSTTIFAGPGSLN